MGIESIHWQPCAATLAVRTIGESRSDVSHLLSVLEAALDEAATAAEEDGEVSPRRIRAINLARVAADLAVALEKKLGAAEEGLADRARERGTRLVEGHLAAGWQLDVHAQRPRCCGE